MVRHVPAAHQATSVPGMRSSAEYQINAGQWPFRQSAAVNISEPIGVCSAQATRAREGDDCFSRQMTITVSVPVHSVLTRYLSFFHLIVRGGCTNIDRHELTEEHVVTRRRDCCSGTTAIVNIENVYELLRSKPGTVKSSSTAICPGTMPFRRFRDFAAFAFAVTRQTVFSANARCRHVFSFLGQRTAQSDGDDRFVLAPANHAASSCNAQPAEHRRAAGWRFREEHGGRCSSRPRMGAHGENGHRQLYDR